MSEPLDATDRSGTTGPTPARDDRQHRSAVRVMHEQAERLGLLDALDAEPALIYRPLETPR